MIGTPFAGYATSSTLPDNFDSYPSNTSVMSANNYFRGDARCDPRGIHVIRRSMKLYILYPLQVNNNNESRECDVETIPNTAQRTSRPSDVAFLYR